MARTRQESRDRSLTNQIIFLVAVAVCTILSYYSTSVRIHRSSQDKEDDPFERSFTAKDEDFLPNLEGFKPHQRFGKSAFTLPWDDWPPQQVHSLFFAHKELPRTEEFDTEELGILHEKLGGGQNKREKKRGDERGHSRLLDAGSEESLYESDLVSDKDESGFISKKAETQSTHVAGQAGAEQREAKGLVDDGRGDEERQLRIERGQFHSPPDLYDAISDEGYHQCVQRASDWTGPPAVEERGYLFPALDGGLSQQVFEIANAVVIARVLNVTLIVPEMRADAFWKDGSDFESIFDLRTFKRFLSEDIRVITMRELPEEMRGTDTWIYVDRVQEGLPADYETALGESFSPANVTYLYSMWGALQHVIDLPYEKLRCRAKYQALQFSPTVVTISKALQKRMRDKASGPFLAVHLRFEVDMVMHQAGCDYGINDSEEEAFWIEERKRRGWPEARPNELMRENGFCPPTPEEIGKWLQGLGFNRSTQVYLASGKPYHEDVFLPPFFDMFPHTFKKEDLFTAEETALVRDKNNVLAAIDFGVLAEADVVALTFHGVMKLSLTGHRSWNGFHKTFLYPVWASWDFRDLEWEDYKQRVVEKTTVGRPKLRTEEDVEEVMANPVPDCMCRS